jgi:hypothetical protein
MAWTETLNAKQSKLLSDDTCPTCTTQKLRPVSPSGRTVVCSTCNGAYIKPINT